MRGASAEGWTGRVGVCRTNSLRRSLSGLDCHREARPAPQTKGRTTRIAQIARIPRMLLASTAPLLGAEGLFRAASRRADEPWASSCQLQLELTAGTGSSAHRLVSSGVTAPLSPPARDGRSLPPAQRTPWVRAR